MVAGVEVGEIPTTQCICKEHKSLSATGPSSWLCQLTYGIISVQAISRCGLCQRFRLAGYLSICLQVSGSMECYQVLLKGTGKDMSAGASYRC